MNDRAYEGEDLTVVICAYQECLTLEKSVRSIIRQTVKPKVLISTSTPNAYIQNIAVNLYNHNKELYKYILSQPRFSLILKMNICKIYV